MIRARLRLFGEPILTTGPDPHTGPVDLPPSVELLLAYLALHPDQAIDRRKLAFVLWPDTTEAAALRNLRQHLHRLRQILASLALPDEILSGTGSQLYFKPDATLWIDAHQFERQVTDQRWQIEAIELYRGNLLANYEADWIQPVRTRLREHYLSALRNQITIANMQRNYGRSLHYATRLLRATPLRESSHRIFMEALYFNGQRIQALQHYNHLKKLLKETLNTEPMPHTEALYRQIQSGTLPGDIPPLIPSTQQAPETLKTLSQIGESFVGRREALRQLDDALARTLNGWGGMVLIEGESGLGKTRLLQTWQQARAERMVLFCGHAQAVEAGIPAAPVLEALHRGYSQINWSRFPAHTPWLNLQRLLSERNGNATSPKARPVSENWPDVNQLGQFILTLASQADRPVGLLLDDLHNADEATWQLVAFLGRRSTTVPLLVVGTYRPNLLPTVTQRILRSLERHRHLQRIELWPLSPADTARLATHLLADRATPAKSFLNHIYRLTEGNPFFITEYLKSAQFKTDEAAFTSTVHIPPPTVQTVVSARLGRLSPESRTLLTMAAAIGRHFSFRVLTGAAAPRYTENQVLDALERWLAEGLVVEQSDGYEFKHEQIQLGAYAGLDEEQRRHLHQEIARALTTLPLEPRLRDPARLAHHYLHSHTPRQALPHLLTSGRRALSLNALSEAETLAHQSLELLTTATLNDLPARLITALEKALQPPADVQQAYELLEQIITAQEDGRQ